MQKMPDLKAAAWAATKHFSSEDVAAMMPQPVIILSAPRSGSTLLFEQLAQFNQFWTIGGESHAVFRAFPDLRAENSQLDSMALGENHADPELCDMFRRCFLFFLRTPQGVPYLSLPPIGRPKKVCLLEKTPRNALNIPFLLRVFPDARFIFLHRDPRQTVSSLIEAWNMGLQTGQFITFRDLPDWPLPGWCFVLPSGWRDYRGSTIAEIAAFQWRACNTAMIDGLSEISADRVARLNYTDLIANPATAMRNVSQKFGLDIDFSPLENRPLPLSRTTVSAPHPQKWKRHEKELEELWPALSKTNHMIDKFFDAI